MKTILDDLKTEKAVSNTDYNTLLGEAGFVVDVQGYQKINRNEIQNYLKKQIERFIKEVRKESIIIWDSGKLEEREEGGYKLFYIRRGTGLKLTEHWVETCIKDFKCHPPKHVLESIIKAKPDFDEIKIVTIEEVLDPLVVGIKKNDPDRYLIDYWENDIDPSELIEE